MKIVICASMSAINKMNEIAEKLKKLGHQVILPKNTELYLNGTIPMENANESARYKIEDDLIKSYFKKISESDAVLAINIDKSGIKNYIGGNTFLELGFAYVLNKKIFLLNPIPSMSYTDEIIAIEPIVLNGNLKKIK